MPSAAWASPFEAQKRRNQASENATTKDLRVGGFLSFLHVVFRIATHSGQMAAAPIIVRAPDDSRVHRIGLDERRLAGC